jgi:hypothetical protein
VRHAVAILAPLEAVSVDDATQCSTEFSPQRNGRGQEAVAAWSKRQDSIAKVLVAMGVVAALDGIESNRTVVISEYTARALEPSLLTAKAFILVVQGA